ncbi:MAG: hypothetical protein EZS28_053391 [Streblomastix strix]|uniref:Uncharacterized protein n=1 Tax=Streblomastix strix TaxID=222440 RepID=A0A5J4RCK7_9EUKA|nr:MAG: hypothetical protein EZS28_053391 [Streblomastix strix]
MLIQKALIPQVTNASAPISFHASMKWVILPPIDPIAYIEAIRLLILDIGSQSVSWFASKYIEFLGQAIPDCVVIFEIFYYLKF